MCGISGVWLKPNETASEVLLSQMAQAMVRRGPDAQGVFVEGSFGFSHRRLKIIDLSEAANQPLFNEDGKVGVVFNGEIYNFPEIKARLLKMGHRFRSGSDTEVIVHAFEAWGVSSFSEFNGIFAFALWDRREKPTLYLARDRFGIKPLYYTETAGRFAFASELKALMTLDWIKREVDPQTLYHFLEFSHVPHPASILKGIFQLNPGAWLRRCEGKVFHGRYYDPIEVHSRVEKSEPDEAGLLRELDQVLNRAVERQLVSDVPIGCFLSGGIDSSLLTSAYTEVANRTQPIQTFSIGYREVEFDESSHAREIAKLFGTEHFEWIAQPKDFFELIPKLPELSDQPLGDPTLISSLLLARFAKEKVTVALSGDGGDELFYGYPHQRALLALEKLAILPKSLREKALKLLDPLFKWGTHQRAIQRGQKLSDILAFDSRAELFQSFIGTIGPLRPNRLAGLILAPVQIEPAYFTSLLEEIQALKSEDQITQVFLRTFLVDTVLAKTDRAGMAFGLEARVPFLDHELVEFSTRVPQQFKLRNGQSKYLLRKLLAKKMQARNGKIDLSRRKKQGFSIPMRDWLRGDLKYLLDQYLEPEKIKREGIFSAPNVERLVQEHLSNRANHSHLLWSLINFQLWRERYL